MRYKIIILFSLLLTSCGVYQVSTVPKVKIDKVLTITSTGDTLAVPIKDFQKFNYNNFFDNQRYNFNYGFGWYNYYYPFNYGFNYRPMSWYYRDWYYKPPIYNYSFRLPEVEKPRVYMNGRRGSNNSGGSSRGNRIILKPNSNNNSNDQISRFNFRSINPPESNSNGRRSWSGENIPVKPVKPIITPPSQPRQIYRGSGSSGVQQSISRGSTSGQRGGGTIRRQN